MLYLLTNQINKRSVESRRDQSRRNQNSLNSAGFERTEIKEGRLLLVFVLLFYLKFTKYNLYKSQVNSTLFFPKF